MYALVDDADAERVAAVDWRVAKSPGGKMVYAVTDSPRIGKDCRWMHRLILRPALGQWIDHIDGDGLNNRRFNLRLATSSQNAQNSFVQAREDGKSSRFKGVSWDKARNRWVAAITLEGRREHLGEFLSEYEAARAYDAAAVRLFGEFARTNEMMGLYSGSVESRIKLHCEGEIVRTPIHDDPPSGEAWKRVMDGKPSYVKRLHRLRSRVAASQQRQKIRNARPQVPAGGR